jgi:lysophospholipase L1-like esterase/pimeloyl-ACP methyl ester carboxylesterase
VSARAIWFGLLTGLAAQLPCAGLASEPAKLRDVRRIVFLGDSITYGGQYIEFIEAWFVTRFPDRQVEFLNIGLPSETVSGLSEPGHAAGKFPRPDLHERLGRVLEECKPDLVVACYGMNDGIYHPFGEERFQRFEAGIRRLRERCAGAGAKVLHLTPPTFDPVPIKDRTLPAGQEEYRQPFEGYNGVLDRYSEWLLARRADGWEVADIHGPMNRALARRREKEAGFVFARDGVHANEAGHWLMARQVLLHLGSTDIEQAETPAAMVSAHPRGAELLKLIQQRQRMLKDAWLNHTGHLRPGMKAGLPLEEAQAKGAELGTQIKQLATAGAVTSASQFPGKKSEWQGFDRYDFDFDGKTATVVTPKRALPGKPWAWRGEFFGAFANADAALVTNGFHLAYLRVPDLFGSPQAVKHWNAFHAELTGRYGLTRKPALIGLSRGGLYCFNWAAANPEKVACIYADAAVCDFKSWPGGALKKLGKGKGSAAEWNKMLRAYGFASDEEAVNHRGNPVDNLAPIAAAGVPVLLVYGDADDVVPHEENSMILAERYRKLGGSVSLIPKPGVGHHPHGLSDPTPVVQFILQHAR